MQEEEDFQDFLRMKGDMMEALKTEFSNMSLLCEQVQASATSKEREVTQKTAELALVRDQISGCKRVVDDSISARENLQRMMDSMGIKSRGFNDKESQNRSELRRIDNNREDLIKALTVGADWRPDQVEMKASLEKERDFLQQKLESKQNELKSLRVDVERGYEAIADMDVSLKALEDEEAQVRENIASVDSQVHKATLERENKEKEVVEMRKLIVEKEGDLAERKRIFAGEDSSLRDLDLNLKAAKELMNEYIKELEDLYIGMNQKTRELEKERKGHLKYEGDVEEKDAYVKLREVEVKAVIKELKKLVLMKKAVVEKIGEAERDIVVAEQKRDKLTETIAQIESVEIRAARRDIEANQKIVAQLKRELEVLNKKYNSSEKQSKQFFDLIVMNQQGKKNLLVEKKTIEDEVKIEQDQIQVLIQEKEKYEHEGEIANQRYYTALEELKLQELQIKELQKKTIDDQGRLKHKQNLYDAVRSDRNLYNKQLMVTQEEIGRLKRKFKSMTVHIDQLKDEIGTKDHSIVKEHFNHHSVDKERELLKNEITKIKKQVQSSESIVESQQVELLKLGRIIDEADLERQRQNSELSNVTSERNLLTAQVVKRNFELTQMYEKIKVSRSTLYIGERNYIQLLENLKQWQDQLRLLVEEQNGTVESLAGMDELRRRVVQLEKEYRQETVKTRALSDEVQRPMNVHRWRILESSDPQRFDKIRQIQDLQKLLMNKSDEVVQTDLLVQEKEKIYVELKNVIARQPGPETEDQLLTYQQTYKAKSKQLESLQDELEMYREQVVTFKNDILKCEEGMTRLKKRWFKMRQADEARQ